MSQDLQDLNTTTSSNDSQVEPTPSSSSWDGINYALPFIEILGREDWLKTALGEQTSMSSFLLPNSIKKLLKVVSAGSEITQAQLIIKALQVLLIGGEGLKVVSSDEISLESAIRRLQNSDKEEFQRLISGKTRELLGISEDHWETAKFALSFKDRKKWIKARGDYLNTLSDEQLRAEGYYEFDDGSCFMPLSYDGHERIEEEKKKTPKLAGESHEEWIARLRGEGDKYAQGEYFKYFEDYWKFEAIPRDERMFIRKGVD